GGEVNPRGGRSLCPDLNTSQVSECGWLIEATMGIYPASDGRGSVGDSCAQPGNQGAGHLWLEVRAPAQPAYEAPLIRDDQRSPGRLSSRSAGASYQRTCRSRFRAYGRAVGTRGEVDCRSDSPSVGAFRGCSRP